MAKDGQQSLIDTDHPDKAKILKLCARIRGHDEDRAEAQSKAAEGRKELGDLLMALKIDHFVGGEFDVTLKATKVKVSVKKRKTEDEE